jgi:tetratricopeptide (TPR) repeat protein
MEKRTGFLAKIAPAGCVVAALVTAACDRSEATPAQPGATSIPAAMLPRAPGDFAPSLVTMVGASGVAPGEMLADTDSCATCHPDAAAQWAQSAHSFASFGNPIYRANVERLRKDLGQEASRHCGGCHDMPLLFDGLMVGNPIPADDLRSHSGVTCRLCHGIQKVTADGNGSYLWSARAVEAPVLGDPISIAAHKAEVSVTAIGTDLCIGCHRGFLSADLGMPAHLVGVDEPSAWRNSPWMGNGMARIDKVARKTCIDCHMEREPASPGELGARAGTLASHRFIGGHTWMAAMRGDDEHLAKTRAKLEGAASIDIAAVRYADGRWQLPADGAALPARGAEMAFDVVIRNLLVGHRFPGGVLDMHDTWIELEIRDRAGERVASSGLDHELDPHDRQAHVLQSLVVDEHGSILELHELARFRAVVGAHTLAAREAQVIRYAFAVPELPAAVLPLTVTARLRHRSRTLRQQAEVCAVARGPEGRQFLRGARGARDVRLDPCAAQPITLIAAHTVSIGPPGGEISASARPAWLRMYEHGMALTSVVSERLEEARQVLTAALTQAQRLGCAPAAAGSDECRAEAMVLTQLAVTASRQGRSDEALGLLEQARRRLIAPYPAALDAIAADALARVWRWREAVPFAQRAAAAASGNSGAWTMLARSAASAGDDRLALAAAQRGLALAPRDADLLRTQATALAALGAPDAAAALAAYERFRAPDPVAELRILCARTSEQCRREREMGHTHRLLLPAARR